MKQSYSVKSGVSVTQQNAQLSARTSIMTSPSQGPGLFSRQTILQRGAKPRVQDKNITNVVSSDSETSAGFLPTERNLTIS